MKIHFVESNYSKDSLKQYYTELYNNYSYEECDVVVCIGGDGFLLEFLHTILSDKDIVNKPVYGINTGTVGFLLNSYNKEDDILLKIKNSKNIVLNPLCATVYDKNDKIFCKYAFNEVSLYRQTRQAAKLTVSINDKTRIEEIIGDGILLSTPAGSTAYNRSAGGPIVPLGGNLLPLTPICPFRPRNWHGALLPYNSIVKIEVNEEEKRPVALVADSFEIQYVVKAYISIAKDISVNLLFNDKDCLEEKIFSEQFYNI